MAKRGRPSKYKPEMVVSVKDCAGRGYTDARLAELFHVTEQTINNWKRDYPEFFESLQEGKDLCDDAIERSLFERASGYSHPDVHVSAKGAIVPIVKHYPPETAAMIFWLKNRRPKKWRERTEIEHSGNLTLNDAAIALGVARGPAEQG